MNRYYVYEWYIVETGEVFYVGKGCGNRYRTRKRENMFFMRMLNTHECDSRIVMDNLTEEEAYSKEIELIHHYRINTNYRLSNIADGGNAPPVRTGERTAEQRAKHSKALKKYYENADNRKKQSAKLKEFYSSEKGKKTASERSKKNMQNEKTKEKISVSNRTRWTDELRKKHSQKMKKAYSNPQARANVTGANNGNSKAVLQIKDGEVIARYETLVEAERQTGIRFKNISKVLCGGNKTAGGYVWKYADKIC